MISRKKYHFFLKCTNPLVFSRSICARSGRHWPSNRSPLSKSNASKTKKATHILFSTSNLWIGEKVSQTKIFGIHRTSHIGQKPKNDRCSSQNMVSKQKNKMEVHISRHKINRYDKDNSISKPTWNLAINVLRWLLLFSKSGLKTNFDGKNYEKKRNSNFGSKV